LFVFFSVATAGLGWGDGGRARWIVGFDVSPF